jgi:hypothetical protein
MTEEQKREEQRKVENRVQRWNESVQKVRDLQREWQKENEEKFGPFLHPEDRGSAPWHPDDTHWLANGQPKAILERN